MMAADRRLEDNDRCTHFGPEGCDKFYPCFMRLLHFFECFPWIGMRVIIDQLVALRTEEHQITDFIDDFGSI